MPTFRQNWRTNESGVSSIRAWCISIQAVALFSDLWFSKTCAWDVENAGSVNSPRKSRLWATKDGFGTRAGDPGAHFEEGPSA